MLKLITILKNENKTRVELSNYLNMHIVCLRDRLNCKADFKIEELEKISTFFNNKYTIEEFLLDI